MQRVGILGLDVYSLVHESDQTSQRLLRLASLALNQFDVILKGNDKDSQLTANSTDSFLWNAVLFILMILYLIVHPH